MARKQLEKCFKAALDAAGFEVLPPGSRRRPSRDEVVASPFGCEVEAVYRSLGGILDEFPLRPGPWDVETDEALVEFDEEQHFNRYRAATLDSPVYGRLSAFPLDEYRAFCRKHENHCLRKASHLGYWDSDSTRKQFGQPGPRGDLVGAGAPRWKQRAFYDFVKDLTPRILDVAVARVAIWDQIEVRGESVLVGDALKRRDLCVGEALVKLIRDRIA